MPVTITCPHCGAAGNAPDHILGQTVRCSKCKQSFVAGGAPAAAAPPPVPNVTAPPPPPAVEDIEEAPPAPRRKRADDDYDDGYEDPGRPMAGARGSSPFMDFLLFRRMVAPLLIMVVFWVLILFVIGACLLGMVGALMQGGMGAVVGLLGGLIGLILGPLWIRVMCEAMIVMFRISETLTDIKNILESRQ